MPYLNRTEAVPHVRDFTNNFSPVMDLATAGPVITRDTLETSDAKQRAQVIKVAAAVFVIAATACSAIIGSHFFTN